MVIVGCRSAVVQRRASAAAELVRRRSLMGSLTTSDDSQVDGDAPADADAPSSAVDTSVPVSASVSSSPPKANVVVAEQRPAEPRTPPLTIPRVRRRGIPRSRSIEGV
jgi:hypothetical protein